MSATIDYYFTSVSPFAWLGHKVLVDIATRHGKKINYRPFNMMKVWEVSGAVPLNQRSATRQRYRLLELQRVAELRGLDINPKPSNFPANPELADRCIIAICQAGGDPDEFCFKVGEALWRDDRQIADESVLGELLADCGFDSAAILSAAKGDAVAAIREQNSADAIAADAIGSPAYVYEGEVFWGQDRLEYLDAMIASGRASFARS